MTKKNGKAGENIQLEKEELKIPAIMDTSNGNGSAMQEVVKDLRSDMSKSNRGMELSKYAVQEGMQVKEKVPFFSEFTNFDDVLRMNTIEAFVTIAPLIIRKTSTHNMEKIVTMLNNVYIGHRDTHKTNMTSLNRKREEAYVKILASDSSDSGVMPSGFKKFFGIGGKK